MTRHSYPSDLSAEQWAALKVYRPAGKPGGRPRSVDPQGLLLRLVCPPASLVLRHLNAYPQPLPGGRAAAAYHGAWHRWRDLERHCHLLHPPPSPALPLVWRAYFCLLWPAAPF